MESDLRLITKTSGREVRASGAGRCSATYYGEMTLSHSMMPRIHDRTRPTRVTIPPVSVTPNASKIEQTL